MQTKIKGIARYADKTTGEMLDKYTIYLSDSIKGLRMYKSGLTEADCTSVSLFDSYIDSVVYDAISTLKEGRIYSDLLNNAIDKDSVINLLLCGADIDISDEKVDSENPDNTLGFYYKYEIKDIVLNIDTFDKVSIFEMYIKTFKDKSQAYLAFIAKSLGVYEIYESMFS